MCDVKVQIRLFLPTLLVIVCTIIGAVSFPLAVLYKKHHDRPPRYTDQALDEKDGICCRYMGVGYVWDDGVEVCVTCSFCTRYSAEPHCRKCLRYGFITFGTSLPTTAPTLCTTTSAPNITTTTLLAKTTARPTTTPEASEMLPTTMPEASTLPTTQAPPLETTTVTPPTSKQGATKSTMNMETTSSNSVTEKATQGLGVIPTVLIVVAAVAVFIALCLWIIALVLTLKNPWRRMWKLHLGTEETGTPAENRPMATLSVDASEE